MNFKKTKLNNMKLFKLTCVSIFVLMTLCVSCNSNPYPAYVQSNQQYQVITDPLSGQQQVVYSRSGMQYVVPYNQFMEWYNYGGYGYVSSMYNQSPNYFRSYNSDNYQKWKSSSFRDTYRGPARTYSNSYNNNNSYNKTSPGTFNNTSNGSSFGTSNKRSNSNSSFGSSKSSNSNSSFGSSRSNSSKSSSSSFGSRSKRS